MSFLLLISIKISAELSANMFCTNYHTSTVAKIDLCLRKVHEEMGSRKLCI